MSTPDGLVNGENPFPAKPSRYTGMTIPERLFAAGLLETFEAAVRQKDRFRLMQALTTVDIEDPASVLDEMLREKRG